jgi:hypothetical protein
MARGDAFADSFINFAGAVSVDIQPAAGVEVMITQILTNSTDMRIKGKDSAGNVTASLLLGQFGGSTAYTYHVGQYGPRTLKIAISNSQFIQLYNNSTTTYQVACYGIQTK